MTWEVVSVTHEKNGDVPVITKKLVGHVDNSGDPAITVDIELTLSTPADAKGPVPVIMEFGLSRELMAMLMPSVSRSSSRRRDPPGSSRCWPAAGVMPNTFPPACRPTTAPA